VLCVLQTTEQCTKFDDTREEVKRVPINAMKTYKGSRCIAPLILNLVVSSTNVPIELEAGWAPEPVWSFWRRGIDWKVKSRFSKRTAHRM